MRAAKDLGRKGIMCEIEERYCEIAAKRLRQNVFDFEINRNGESDHATKPKPDSPLLFDTAS